jgi:pimeloyl-ACP methyl ester carboxylesterase
MNEYVIQANGVDICAESFGDPSNPALLLIMGATASMLWWPDELCRLLAQAGRYVVRYDNRDTGRSVRYPPGQPGYSLEDLPDDAIGVLDAHKIDRAHLIGMSLGGMIAQVAALKHPQRVATITLISSSVFGPDNPDLPPIDEKVIAYHKAAATVDWTDEDAVVDFMTGGWRLTSGSAHSFEAELIRATARREFRRSRNLLSMFNHALLTGAERWYNRIGEISVPTLVIHGTEDRVLPYPHGVALARTIPGAKLVTLSGSGHELHRDDWNVIANAILEHTTADDPGDR